MNDPVKTALDRLGWLTFWDRHVLTPPAQVVKAVEALLRELASAWGTSPTAFLGPVLDNPAPEASAIEHEYRAVALIPDGIGVLVWTDAEREANKRLRSGGDNQMAAEFLPFQRCHPAVQSQLFPLIEPLLERIYRDLTGRTERT